MRASRRTAADGLRPARLVGVERAPEPGQLVHVEEPGDLLPRVLRDAETGVGVPFAQAPLLGPEHHRTQYLEGAVGRAGLVPAGRVEPGGHILRTDAVEQHPAERGQDVGLQVDAHGPAPGGLPVLFAAALILVRELPQRRGLLLPLDVVCRIAARTDAREHVAGAAAGLRKVDLTMPGDNDTAVVNDN